MPYICVGVLIYLFSCHFQVVKLHTKLGKPIPSTEPSVVTQTSTSTTAATNKTAGATISSSTSTTASVMNISSSTGSNSSYLKPIGMVNNSAASAIQGKGSAPSGISSTTATIKKANTPKINFVGTCCFACYTWFWFNERYL